MDGETGAKNKRCLSDVWNVACVGRYVAKRVGVAVSASGRRTATERGREGEDQVDSLNHMLSVSIDRRSFIKMLLLTLTEEEEKKKRK